MAVLLVQSGCKAPEQQAKASPAKATIRNTGYNPPVLNLDVSIPGNERSGALLVAAGDAVLDTGKAVTEGRLPVAGPLKTINFTFHGPKRPGDDTQGRFTHLTYDVGQLRTAVHMGASGETLLGLASEGSTWSPTNDDIVKDYCGTRGEDRFCLDIAGYESPR